MDQNKSGRNPGKEIRLAKDQAFQIGVILFQPSESKQFRIIYPDGATE
jgi:hypothetical protein